MLNKTDMSVFYGRAVRSEIATGGCLPGEDPLGGTNRIRTEFLLDHLGPHCPLRSAQPPG